VTAPASPFDHGPDAVGNSPGRLRILVGIMHSGELEFEQCVAAVKEQAHQQVEVFTIENVPHAEAHRILYETFMAKADRFDIFIKVDADMVITDRELFRKIAGEFAANTGMDMLAIAVHDFFPNRLVFGMYCYRSCVRWPAAPDRVFVDKQPVPAERSVCDESRLAPAALHCHNASPIQCFRYGVVRGVKFLAAARDGWLFSRSINYIDDTWQQYLITGDRRRLLASAGAELALKGVLNAEHLDYGNDWLRRQCELYDGMPTRDLLSLTRRLRIINALRRPALLLLKRIRPARPVSGRRPRKTPHCPPVQDGSAA